MIIPIKWDKYTTLTDSSQQCNETSLFLKTVQNYKFEKDAINLGAKIISPSMCYSLLNINENIKIIGITGTNGKTTTGAGIYSSLLDLGYKVGFQGTRGCFINNKKIEDKSLTTPSLIQTFSNLQKATIEECEYFVMEVSSHGIEQNRIEGIGFALKIFTNLSQDHLDYHKNMDNYSEVKSRFFQDDSVKLINSDERELSYSFTNLFTYGIENNANYKVVSYSLKNQIDAVIENKNKNKIFELESSLQGIFNLYNLTAVLGAVDILTNKSSEETSKALAGFGGVKGRMEVVCKNPLIIIDFAHTPDGMEKVLYSMMHKSLVIVFGAGGNRDKTKRPLMGKIAKRYGKRIYITSDNPRFEDPKIIIDDIVQGINDMNNVYTITNRKTAIKTAIADLKKDEILVILGRGDEENQEIMGKKIPFSDSNVVKTILKEISKERK